MIDAFRPYNLGHTEPTQQEISSSVVVKSDSTHKVLTPESEVFKFVDPIPFLLRCQINVGMVAAVLTSSLVRTHCWVLSSMSLKIITDFALLILQ